MSLDDADALSTPQRRFVDEYLSHANGTRAYRAAYPGATYAAARTAAARLRKVPAVAAELKAGRAAQRQRTRLDADRLLRELAAVAFSDIGDLFDADGHPLPPHLIDPVSRSAVASLTVTRTVSASGEVTETFRVRFWDKLRALELLARHLGLSRPLPPLEAVLQLLPPELRTEVTATLAAYTVQADGRRSFEPTRQVG
jgi:phage terminase small subunit